MKTDEKVIVECKTHWIGFILPAILGAFFLIGAIYYLFKWKLGDAGILLIGALIFFVPAYLTSKCNSLILTDKAIIGKTGIIRTKKLVSPVNKIQDLSISNGLLGKIFGYHTIHVSTAGSNGAEYTFKHMMNAKKLQKEFVELS